MSGEWREPEDIAADLASADLERVRAGLVAFLEFTRYGDEFDLPPLEPWVLGLLGDAPGETVVRFARLLMSYQSFVPRPGRAHVVRQVVELSMRYGLSLLCYEASIEIQGQADPVAAARDAVGYLRARGLADGEVAAAETFIGYLLGAKQPVRRAAAQALADWPDSAAKRAVVAFVLSDVDPDQRALLRTPSPGAPLPTMRFEDTAVDRAERYAIGVERGSGRYYLAIPASNGLVDYEEYYEIDAASYERWLADLAAALPFVRRCRARQEDPRLLYQPSIRRGSAT